MVAQCLRGGLAVAGLDGTDDCVMLGQSILAPPLRGERGGRQKRHRTVHEIELLDEEPIVRGQVNLFVKPPIGARSSSTMSRSTRISSGVACIAASRAASPSSSARTV